VEALARKASAGPLVILDEFQKVPALLDAVQDLIDRKVARFVLSGSSARKLRRGASVNFLPGRVVAMRLDPLSVLEVEHSDLESALLWGTLPGIVQVAAPEDRDIDLDSYVTTYLEEEVRAEALVRSLGPFGRFLELAGAESGRIANFSKLSQEIGVAHTTIASYYTILEDCLIAEPVEPITTSKVRRRLTRTRRYLFFDMGVRRAAARERAELRRDSAGALFEQFVGLELIRLTRFVPGTQVRFWRDPGGPEVDWVLDTGREYIPIEVKWTDAPTASDSRHVGVFLSEYSKARRGYVVCRTPRTVELSDAVRAIPWRKLPEVLGAQD
jgi:predicted AAA+ superfamily ATPase